MLHKILVLLNTKAQLHCFDGIIRMKYYSQLAFAKPCKVVTILLQISTSLLNLSKITSPLTQHVAVNPRGICVISLTVIYSIC
jgi:hypothetical protein